MYGSPFLSFCSAKRTAGPRFKVIRWSTLHTPRSASLSFGTGFWRCRMLIERAKPSRDTVCFHCCASSLARVILYINECLGQCEEETNDSIATAPLGLMRIPVLFFGGVSSAPLQLPECLGIQLRTLQSPNSAPLSTMLLEGRKLPVAFEKSRRSRSKLDGQRNPRSELGGIVEPVLDLPSELGMFARGTHAWNLQAARGFEERRAIP